MFKITIQERFWEKVVTKKTNHCWKWKAYVSKSTGYGQFQNSDNVPTLAHRMSWILTYGEIPKGLWVLHKCDNKVCVNPYHLFLGTWRDNVNDMIAKGRNVKGKTHGMYIDDEFSCEKDYRKRWRLRCEKSSKCPLCGAGLGENYNKKTCQACLDKIKNNSSQRRFNGFCAKCSTPSSKYLCDYHGELKNNRGILN